jgi:hypothetical protein
VRREELDEGLVWAVRYPDGRLASTFPAEARPGSMGLPPDDYALPARLAAHRWAADR